MQKTQSPSSAGALGANIDAVTRQLQSDGRVVETPVELILPKHTLMQKLLEIGGEVGHVSKDARNPHHGYQYASEKVIKEAVYPKFREKGIFFQLEVAGQPYEMGRKGVTDDEGIFHEGPYTALMVPFRYRFVDVGNGEEITGDWLGVGRAGDDKGFYIAVTGAIKYAITTHCGIVTGDDPEEDRPVSGASVDRSREKDQLLMCDRCGEIFPLSKIHPKGRFQAQWADKSPDKKWEVGDLMVFCPSCPRDEGKKKDRGHLLCVRTATAAAAQTGEREPGQEG